MARLCTLLLAVSCFLFPSLGRAVVTIQVPADMALQAALTAAQSDGDDTVINIAPGTYDASGATFTYVGAENFSLTLTGAGTGATILDGGGLQQVMNLQTGAPDDLADISLQGLAFQNGDTSVGGGLNVLTADANVTLDDVLFFQNGAAIGGGLEVVTGTGNITLTNNVFDSNAQAFIGAGLDAYSDSGTITLQGNQFIGNASGAISGGANIYNDSGDIHLDDNIFDGNTVSGAAIAGGADIVTGSGNINLRRNQFLGNSSDVISGGFEALSSGGGAIVIDSNLIVGNSSNNIIGGCQIGSAGSVVFTNNIVSGNSAVFSGGGVRIYVQSGGSGADIINNTITGNTAGSEKGGLELSLSDNAAVGNIYNNIVWANTSPGDGADIFVLDDGDADNVGSPVNLFNNDFTSLFFACVAPGCTPNVNQGDNLNGQDPLFVNAAMQDFHLGTGSPVIDKGLASAPSLPATDFDGNPRVLGAAPDMGALEALPNITLSPATNDYGSLTVGTSASAVFTITNNGAGGLSITGMTLSDTTHFSLDPNGGPNPCASLTPTLATGESCTVAVIFQPQTNGSFSATLIVSSDDPAAPTVQAVLTGIGSLNPFISGGGCSLAGAPSSAQPPMAVLWGISVLAFLAMAAVRKEI